MVNIEMYGKTDNSENQAISDAANTAALLASGLNSFSGIKEKTAFINKITQAEGLIDTLVAFKTLLGTMKTTLQNA